MQTILVREQPNTKDPTAASPLRTGNFPVIDSAETSTPCDAAAANAVLHTDRSRVPAIGEPGSSRALPFVLQFLVMREERPAAELAEAVRHTSEAPADVCSATATSVKRA